jgi:hypothetical protein
MHAAWLRDPGSQAPRAVGGQQAQQRWDWHVGTVFLQQTGDAGLAAAVAEIGIDLDARPAA